MFGMSPMEMMIVGVVAILLFGQKLPEVMKTIGKGYRDFRNGLSEIQSQVNLNDTFSSGSSYASSSSSSRKVTKTYDDYEEPTAPKFDPPPADPSTAASTASSSNASNNDNPTA